jgi:hypothetical protein
MVHSCGYSFYFICLLQFIGFQISFSQPQKYPGAQLFHDYCASCHKPGRELIGPDIRHIRNTRTIEWLVPFVQNSQSLIKKGDPEANSLFIHYKQVIMPQNALSDSQVLQLLNYADTVKAFVSPINSDEEPYKEKLAKDHPRFPIPVIVMILLACICLIFTGMNRMFFQKKNNALFRFINESDIFLTKRVSKVFYVMVIIFIILDLGVYARNYFLYNEMVKATLVSQPVIFSHETHCNTYTIDCICCHTRTYQAKFATLPETGICMKCHNHIRQGEKYGKTEIIKLIKLWYGHKSYRWAEGYRYSQFVHFDHSLHMNQGRLKCSECHKDMIKIEVSKITFNMQWCIKCHQQKTIDFGNNYYKKVFDTTAYNKTVQLAGGNDCSKCHH